MKEEEKRVWSDEIDPETIPVEVLISQLERVPYEAILSLRGRKNIARRKSPKRGGVYWKEHNPNTTRCRCKACMKRRERERAKRAKAAGK